MVSRKQQHNSKDGRRKFFFFWGGRFDTCTAWLNLVDSFVVFRLFCSLLCGCYLSALLFKSGPNGTCVENKPTTAATKERLWCLFELAAFLKSKKTSSRKQTLIVRPIFLGPISIAVFVFCTAVCLPFLTVSFDNAVEGLLGVVVPAALVASFAAYPAVPRLSTFQKPLVEKTADNKQLETFQLWFFATLTFLLGQNIRNFMTFLSMFNQWNIVKPLIEAPQAHVQLHRIPCGWLPWGCNRSQLFSTAEYHETAAIGYIFWYYQELMLRSESQKPIRPINALWQGGGQRMREYLVWKSRGFWRNG